MIELLASAFGTKKIIVLLAVSVIALALTPENITSFFISITALVTALGIGIVNIMSARYAAIERARSAAKLDTVVTTTEVIKGHVNSEKTQDAGQIEKLKAENTLLREVIERQDKDKQLLAQAAAVQGAASVRMTEVARPIQKDVEAVGAIESLKKIDVNTRAIAENTAKTDAKVDDVLTAQKE